jgi:hypothetical protein
VSITLTTAVADVLDSTDLLVCSPSQATELGLRWRPMGEVRLRRGYNLAAVVPDDEERIATRLSEALSVLLGADDPGEARA